MAGSVQPLNMTFDEFVANQQQTQPITSTTTADSQLTSGNPVVGALPGASATASGVANLGTTTTTTASAFITTNPNYQITLTKVGTGLSVVGNAPQDFELNVHNDFTDILHTIDVSFGVDNSAIKSLTNFATSTAKSLGAITGTSLTRVATIQVWTGTAPMEFTVPLSFRAYSNPLVDVMQPLVRTIQMASPQDGGAGAGVALLKSPAPTIADMIGAIANNSSSTGFQMMAGLNNAITMQVGRNIVVPGLVITGLSVKMGTRAERQTGLPIAVEITLSLRTVMSFSQQDVLAMFNQQSQITSIINLTNTQNSRGSAIVSGNTQ